MIDLTYVPKNIQENILYKYQQEYGDRSKMFNYFIEHRLKHLLPDIGDF